VKTLSTVLDNWLEDGSGNAQVGEVEQFTGRAIDVTIGGGSTPRAASSRKAYSCLHHACNNLIGLRNGVGQLESFSAYAAHFRLYLPITRYFLLT
jgi:hypothetical protein